MNFVSQKFIEFYKQRPVLTTVNLGVSLLFPIDDVLLPYLTGKVVTLLETRDKRWMRYLMYMIIIYLFMQSIYTITYWHDAKLLPELQNYIRHNMVGDYLEQFQNDYKEANLGEIMSRFVKIPVVSTNLYETVKNYIIPYIFSFIITGIIIAQYDGLLALVLIIIVIAVLALLITSPALCMQATAKQDAALSKVDEEIEDLLRNRQLVYTTDSIKDEMVRIKSYEKRYSQAFSYTMDCVVKTRFVSVCILAVMLVTFYYRSVHGIGSGKLSAGSFVTILTILAQWFVILAWISANIRDVVVDWGVVRAYEEIKKQGQSMFVKSQIPHFSPDSIPSTGILISNVTFRVPVRKEPILDDITIHIPKGEQIVIIGEIGTGKSTLLQLLCKLLSPSSGKIYINGRDLSQVSKRELKKLIVYVPQNPILLNRSIYDNICYGLKGVEKSDVYAILEKLDLSTTFPEGLDLSAGKNGSNLSGGQRQIVQCIRAMLTNPEYIVLDEITASIDKATKAKLLKLLQIMFSNKTVIMVTHDSDLMQLATASIVMKSK